jgi:hypothetical protein
MLRFMPPGNSKDRVEKIDKGLIIKPPAQAPKPKPKPKSKPKTNKK